MALISEIRKHSWVLIVMIALGMLGFLLMDMIGSSRSIFNTSTTIGKINGSKVSVQEFQRKQSLLFGDRNRTDRFEQQRATWDYLVEESLLKKIADQIGIGVSNTELKELFTGKNMSKVVYQEFANQQTGEFDPTQIQNILDNYSKLDPQQKEYWTSLEDRVILDQIGSKYSNLVMKAMYTPTWQVEVENGNRNSRLDFAYVYVPYSSIPDTDIQLTDADINAYVKDNAEGFKSKEPLASLEFVEYDVFPTAADSATILGDFMKIVNEFKTANNDSLFVIQNGGRYYGTYLKKDELPTMLVADTLFKVPVGSYVAPYIENNRYNAVKLIGRMTVPDSVRARHIFIPVQNADFNKEGVAAARKTIDSLKTVLETKANNFDTLAVKFSQDKATAVKGGDLGFLGATNLLPEMRDIMFYTGSKGKLYTVVSRAGVHLLEITDIKTTGATGVRVAFIEAPIVPSEATQNAVKSKALDIAANYKTIDAFSKAAVEKQLNKRSATNLKRNDHFIPGLSSSDASRDLIKWAFEAKPGEVCSKVATFQNEDVIYDNKYVVAALKSITPAGLPTALDARPLVENKVRNMKKAEKISAKISGNDLNAIASAVNSKVDTAKAVNFMGALPIGNEPKAMGAAFALQPSQVSKPLAGETGVLVVMPLAKPTEAPVQDIPTLRQQITRSFQRAINARGNGFIDALKKNATVEDMRYKFF